jgi:hypothetical protein
MPGGTYNLGNVVGLLKQVNPPTKTYVIWAKILNPMLPDYVELYVYDSALLQWVPLATGTNYIIGLTNETVINIDYYSANLLKRVKKQYIQYPTKYWEERYAYTEGYARLEYIEVKDDLMGIFRKETMNYDANGDFLPPTYETIVAWSISV